MPFVRRQRKYYKYGTEPNATVVGTPTVVDGVVSGFAKGVYTYIPKTFDSGSNTWERVFKITTGSDITTDQVLVGCNVVYTGISINIANGLLKMWASSNGTSWDIFDAASSSKTLSANTTYYIKQYFNGTHYLIDVSTTGEFNGEEENYITVESNKYVSNFTVTLGSFNKDGANYFRGSIDFTQSYIKINGKEWWRGTKAVEVPSSSITDFGSYKYYKNIVTTKYWKEITTEGEPKLEYACYSIYMSAIPATLYNYAKTPLGSDMARYYNDANSVVTDSSQLTAKNTQYPWSSITEESAISGLGKATRYPEGDLYIDTTVTETVEGTPEDYTYTTEETETIEVTADDDYDYTEFVPSAEYDYHVDNNKLYQLATVNRSYWKYDYQDFAQPKLTANGTLGGKSFAVAVDSNYDIFYGYKALDGNTSTSWQSMGTTTTGTYFIFYNPLPLNVTKITWSGTPKYGTITEGVVYGSNDNKEYKELATFTGTTTGGTMDLSSNTNYYKYYKITPTQWTDKTNTHTNGWAELSITAKEQIVVEGTSEDYDYYTDRNVSYDIMFKR